MGFEVADVTAGFDLQARAPGEPRAGQRIAHDAVPYPHLAALTGDAQAIPVAPGLDADGVVVDRQVASLDQHPFR